jgi:hypothetical protein
MAGSAAHDDVATEAVAAPAKADGLDHERPDADRHGHQAAPLPAPRLAAGASPHLDRREGAHCAVNDTAAASAAPRGLRPSDFKRQTPAPAGG